jgi:Ca2+-transporting ATPase
LVHDAVPGRTRVKVSGLFRSDALKAELEESLIRLTFIYSVDANVLTGNILIRFDAGVAVARLLTEIERLVEQSDHQRGHPGEAAPRELHPADLTRRPEPQPRTKTNRGARRAPSPPSAKWHARSREAVAELLDSSPEGLAEAVARERLARYGQNLLGATKPRSRWRLLLEQFLSPPVAMLAISAGVSVATGGIVDAVAILGVVGINAIIGFVTENEAEKTINALGKLTPVKTRVMRDGRLNEVLPENIVVGDVLALAPGSYVAADARLISSNELTVDESALTGESLPVSKRAELTAADDTPLADRRNMVYKNTVVTGGSGLAMVVATGSATEIGAIQSLVGEVKTPDTPLQRQLDAMGLKLALASASLCAGVFAIGLLRGQGWLQMLSSSISLAVAAVPEGLPAVATTTLALGIREMQRQHVLIRQLPAVESLGSVHVVCLDKTGTLTMNQMKGVALRTSLHGVTVADGRFYAGHEAVDPLTASDLVRLLRVISLCSEATVHDEPPRVRIEGSPTESALIELAMAAGLEVNALRDASPLVTTVHRAENRPYMITVHRDGERFFLAVKGSPAEVLALCRWQQVDGAREELDEAKRALLLEHNDEMARNALRVLGVAYAYADEPDVSIPDDLVWLGLVGMEDVIRPGMAELIGQFHEAGIETVMITGDQSATAYSVGKRLGLSKDKPLEIVDSVRLDKLDPELLQSIARDTTVFARVSPAHKLKIVQALQGAGYVVAMTGDGINDGPALKAADVGVAMGNHGTDVARSVADVVLEDDNLHTMIAAVSQGRTIYGNIRKSLRFLLSSNMSEIEVMVIGTAAGMGEILNPMQLLWINLLTDIFPALALALEPAERDVLKQPPRDPSQPIIGRADFATMLRESLVLTGGTLAVFTYSLLRYGVSPKAGTNAFMTLTTGQLLHALVCRSERTTLFAADRPPNPYLTRALAGSFTAQILAALIPQLRQLLRLSPIGALDALAIAGGAMVPTLINEKLKSTRPNSAGE